MLRISSRAGSLLVVAALTSAVTASAQEPPPKDPWSILDGTYYAPGTGSLAPSPTAVSVEEAPEEAVDLRGEWKAMAETYRQSLERLGSEDRAALLAKIAHLEVAALGDQPERRMSRLAGVELDVVRRLAEQDPESLVPVFQLHHDLYLEHRQARQWYLLHHSITMVRELAALYVEKAGSQGARVNAARILASLAGHLQAGQQPVSVDLFNEVLRLDPTSEAAYLGLAAHFEKRGGPFEPVVGYLERLLAVYPDHREGRLRLAINKIRLGKVEDGRRGLAALVAEPASDWVYRLAAEELARLEAGTGRLDKAIEVLEKAIENAPGDQKLCIQLAFLYDKNRQSFDAHRLATIASQGKPALEAPRGRYNTWPHKALEQDREELRRAAESRVQLLARILNSAPPAAEEKHGDGPESPEVNP